MEDHNGAGRPEYADGWTDAVQFELEQSEQEQSELEQFEQERGEAETGEADTGEVATGEADAGPGLPLAAALIVPRPETGEPRVDEALSLLDDLPELPVAQHPAVFERVHAQLGEVLGELGSGPLAAAAGRDGS